MNIKNNIKIFLDSGAFSAYSQGIKINIEEYISFIKIHKKHLAHYANLDVIGDPDATLKNQKTMESAGLNPIPCFHYGEPLKYLFYYLKQYDYIALGGMVPISTRDLRRWLDKIFCNYICDKLGIPKVKVHGFGLTSFSLMKRYPWYSVDSTSWVLTGRMGSVYVPKWKNGIWDYTEDAWKIAVSTRSPSKKETGQHIDTLSKSEQQIILNYFSSKGYVLGESRFRFEEESYKLKANERWNGKAIDGQREVELIKEEGLSNNYMLRDELNIIYFLDLEKTMPKWPWPFNETNKKFEGFGL